MNTMVIDGHGIAYRAGHVLSLRSDSGKNTSVIFGLLKMIRSLIEEHLPKAVCVAWDFGGSVAKENLFPGYKIHRRTLDWDKPEDREKVLLAREIKKQIDDLFTIIPAFGMKQIRMEGIEADDIIGLLAEALSLDGGVMVVSSDRDLLQLIKPGISVYYPPKDIVLDVLNFESTMGLNPNLWLDYRRLVGDTSDGISGLKGFGDVTAKRILGHFGNIDEWWVDGRIRIAVLEELNKAQQRTLLSRESKDILERNYQLMKLGHLVQEKRDEIVADYRNHPLEFDVERIHQYFEDNQLHEYLSRFGSWVHTFRRLTR